MGMTSASYLLAQIGGNYVYCCRRNQSLIFDLYGFEFKPHETRHRIQFKHSINLQIYKEKKKIQNVTLLRLQYNCIIFTVKLKQHSIICFFQFNQQRIASKRIFKIDFNLNQIINVDFASNILLFELCKNKKKKSRFYALYTISKQSKLT